MKVEKKNLKPPSRTDFYLFVISEYLTKQRAIHVGMIYLHRTRMSLFKDYSNMKMLALLSTFNQPTNQPDWTDEVYLFVLLDIFPYSCYC